MAKTEELRDGLFSITWIVRNFSSTTPSREVKVDSLQTFLKSCRLTCKFADSFLILKLVSAVPPDPSRKVVVKASYRSFKQTMELGDSKNKSIWGTGWSCVPYSDYVRRIKVEPPNVISFDILIDLKPDCVVSVMKGSKHVLDNLQKLWEHKTRSDVTFQCGDQVIKAHTLILASGSPVLAAMFENGFKESRDGVVLIVDIEAPLHLRRGLRIVEERRRNGRFIRCRRQVRRRVIKKRMRITFLANPRCRKRHTIPRFVPFAQLSGT